MSQNMALKSPETLEHVVPLKCTLHMATVVWGTWVSPYKLCFSELWGFGCSLFSHSCVERNMCGVGFEPAIQGVTLHPTLCLCYYATGKHLHMFEQSTNAFIKKTQWISVKYFALQNQMQSILREQYTADTRTGGDTDINYWHVTECSG